MFNIYGYGSHLGHITRTISTNFLSGVLKSIIFGSGALKMFDLDVKHKHQQNIVKAIYNTSLSCYVKRISWLLYFNYMLLGMCLCFSVICYAAMAVDMNHGWTGSPNQQSDKICLIQGPAVRCVICIEKSHFRRNISVAKHCSNLPIKKWY